MWCLGGNSLEAVSQAHPCRQIDADRLFPCSDQGPMYLD